MHREREAHKSKLTEQVRSSRDRHQRQRLKLAYERMLVFEAERQREKQERSELEKTAQDGKMRRIAVNY